MSAQAATITLHPQGVGHDCKAAKAATITLHPQGVGHDCKAAKAATITLPGAWYDLSARIDAAQAVASCALESLPGNLKGLDCASINHSSNLIAAVQGLLQLAAADVNLIEAQLNK